LILLSDVEFDILWSNERQDQRSLCIRVKAGEVLEEMIDLRWGLAMGKALGGGTRLLSWPNARNRSYGREFGSSLLR
jgi:hypothetical protein